MNSEQSLFDNSGLGANPLNEFSGCHQHIIANFKRLRTLLDLLRQGGDSPEVEGLARRLLLFFQEVVLEHHAEEEQELFVAVMDCADKGEEADEGRRAIRRLVAEHRELEAIWQRLVPAIKRLSRGKRADLDLELGEDLASRYLAHAAYEEQYFLPLAARILSKNEMSALGLTLHMRHQDEDSVGNYI